MPKMIPGVNPRQVQAMMKQMGISQKELKASEVIIKTPDKIIKFTAPSVTQVTMQGQVTFQITGTFKEEAPSFDVKISDEDIAVVMEQASVSKEEAKKALLKSKGDIAEAIVSLNK